MLDLGSLLTSALTGSSGPNGPTKPPASVAALRRKFTAVGVYDGLDLRIKGETTKRLYRDPGQLITGSATLLFNVVGRR